MDQPPNYSALDDMDIELVNKSLTAQERIELSAFIKQCKEDAAKKATKATLAPLRSSV